MIMRPLRCLALFAALAGFHAYGADEPGKEAEKPKSPAPAKGHVFAWPFMDWKEMQPRGGMTQGSEVTLLTGAKESWKRLREQVKPLSYRWHC